MMFTDLHCIALHTVRYSDRHNILSAYSREAGRVSLLVPAGAGRDAARKRAAVMPMSIFECVADIRPGREVYAVRDLRPEVVLHGVHLHPVKNALALFLSEVLSVVLRESPRDATLYAYLRDSAVRLDSMEEGVANFHLAFLYGLCFYLGIAPDMDSYRDGRVFDMRDASFRDTAPLHDSYLTPDDSRALAVLSRISWENIGHFRYSREQRRRILSLMLDYYTIHYASLGRLDSLDIYRALFD